MCDPAKAASLLSSLFNNPSFGRFLSVKPFVPKPVPRVNHDEAKCLQKKVGSLAGHMNTIVRSLKGRLIELVQSKSFRPPSASGFSVGTISFKRVNYRDLQFNNKGSHIDLNIKGLSVTINRINIKIQKTINKFGASFNLNCGGWIEGGISSSNLNSHLYFGKGPVIAIQNSNAQIGNIHLNFHMNGICSVANGMISKSFIASKLKGVVQSLLNSQLAKMEDAISKKINGIPKIKTILGYCGNVMDAFGKNDAKEKDDGSEKRVLIDDMKERAQQPVHQILDSKSTDVSKSLKKKSMSDMQNAVTRKKKITNPPFHETDEEVQNALKKKKKELEIAFL